MFDMQRYIDNHIKAVTRIYFNDSLRMPIQDAASMISEAFKEGNKLLICGNGGSAADALHLAAELVPMGLPAVALSANTSSLTAIANDVDFMRVFSRQVEALGRKGDVLLAISTSGQSMNVRYAIQQAHIQGMNTIAMTGASGIAGRGTDPVIAIKVQSEDTQHIQEAHLMIEHIIWQLIKEAK